MTDFHCKMVHIDIDFKHMWTIFVVVYRHIGQVRHFNMVDLHH